MIKAVAQAIPSYTMSIFKLPLILSKQLQAMIVNFWWGATGSEKKIHWRKWKLLCQSKYNGGLRFRNVVFFNQSLLAKQAWRILTEPHSLASRIFMKKYYPNSSLLLANHGHNPSYIWRSILWGRDLIKKVLRWRVAKGSNLSVFNDPWMSRLMSFKPITPPNANIQQITVGELMTVEGTWDWNLIHNIFWEVDSEEC